MFTLMPNKKQSKNVCLILPQLVEHQYQAIHEQQKKKLVN